MEKLAFKSGALTPALLQMVNTLLSKIARRTDAFLLKEIKGDVTFAAIVDKSRGGKYPLFSDLMDDIEQFLAHGKEHENECVKIVIFDIEKKLRKELKFIEEMSECRFKTIATECVDSIISIVDIKQEEIDKERDKFEAEKEKLLNIRREKIFKAIEKDMPSNDLPVVIRE